MNLWEYILLFPKRQRVMADVKNCRAIYRSSSFFKSKHLNLWETKEGICTCFDLKRWDLFRDHPQKPESLAHSDSLKRRHLNLWIVEGKVFLRDISSGLSRRTALEGPRA